MKYLALVLLLVCMFLILAAQSGPALSAQEKESEEQEKPEEEAEKKGVEWTEDFAKAKEAAKAQKKRLLIEFTATW